MENISAENVDTLQHQNLSANYGKANQGMISKNEAKEIIHRIYDCVNNETCEMTDCAYFNSLKDLEKLLEYVENSSPIVRCMDCKWCKGGKNGIESWKTCSYRQGNHDTFDIFYCFAGELEENENEENHNQISR